MKIKVLLIGITLLISVFGCQKREKKISNEPLKEVKKKFEAVNRTMVEKDREKILAYIERHSLTDMKENQSGLYYLIWGESQNITVKTGDIVTIKYRISLLDGTICGKTEEHRIKEFMVGKGGVESGIEMAVLLMKLGEKGKFIITPHLGYGLLGNNDDIPPMAILVFDVELIEVIAK
jgi:FKBP-type peptidyl-prolyl cis-trans isomerase FkpA